MARKLRGAIRIAVVILIVYWIAIFVMTHIPIRHERRMPIPHLDKVVHFAAYLGLAFLLPFAGRSPRNWPSYCLLFCLASIYGVVDEGLQMFVPTREADVYDWVADSFGAAMGLALHAAARGWFRGWVRRQERGVS